MPRRKRKGSSLGVKHKGHQRKRSRFEQRGLLETPASATLPALSHPMALLASDKRKMKDSPGNNPRKALNDFPAGE